MYGKIKAGVAGVTLAFALTACGGGQEGAAVDSPKASVTRSSNAIPRITPSKAARKPATKPKPTNTGPEVERGTADGKHKKFIFDNITAEFVGWNLYDETEKSMAVFNIRWTNTGNVPLDVCGEEGAGINPTSTTAMQGEGMSPLQRVYVTNMVNTKHRCRLMPGKSMVVPSPFELHNNSTDGPFVLLITSPDNGDFYSFEDIHGTESSRNRGR